MVLNKSKMNWVGQIFALTDYASIERWWEIIFSAYLLVSLHAQAFKDEVTKQNLQINSRLLEFAGQFEQHPYWESGMKSEKCFK
jgi:hypothetical protein